MAAVAYRRSGQGYEVRLESGHRLDVLPGVLTETERAEADACTGAWVAYPVPTTEDEGASIPYTAKDKFWEFTVQHLPGAVGEQVNCKSDWTRIKRRTGTQDDLTFKELAARVVDDHGLDRVKREKAAKFRREVYPQIVETVRGFSDRQRRQMAQQLMGRSR